MILEIGVNILKQRLEPLAPHVALAMPVPVVVAWTARIGNTKSAVAALRRRRDEHPAVFDQLFDTMGGLAEAGIKALEASGVLPKPGLTTGSCMRHVGFKRRYIPPKPKCLKW